MKKAFLTLEIITSLFVISIFLNGLISYMFIKKYSFESLINKYNNTVIKYKESIEMSKYFDEEYCENIKENFNKAVEEQIYLSSNENYITNIKNYNNDFYISYNSNKKLDHDLYKKDAYSIDTGVGIKKFKKMGQYIFAINTSGVKQFSIIKDNENSFELIKDFSLGNNVYLNSFYIKVKDDYLILYLGAQKNLSEELYIYKINLNNMSIDFINKKELNFSINDIFVTDENIFITSPSDTEFIKLDNSLNIIQALNAEGGSGNGKIISPYMQMIFLNRTRGRQEFNISDHNFNNILNNRLSGSVDKNINTEKYSIVLNSNADGELKIFKRNDQYNNSFDKLIINTVNLLNINIFKWTKDISLIKNIDLIGRGNDMTCIDNKLLISILNTNKIINIETYE